MIDGSFQVICERELRERPVTVMAFEDRDGTTWDTIGKESWPMIADVRIAGDGPQRVHRDTAMSDDCHRRGRWQSISDVGDPVQETRRGLIGRVAAPGNERAVDGRPFPLDDEGLDRLVALAVPVHAFPEACVELDLEADDSSQRFCGLTRSTERTRPDGCDVETPGDPRRRLLGLAPTDDGQTRISGRSHLLPVLNDEHPCPHPVDPTDAHTDQPPENPSTVPPAPANRGSLLPHAERQ